MKYDWIENAVYESWRTLKNHVENVLTGFGKEFVINFAWLLKWLASAERSEVCLSEAKIVTQIGDRESDLFEEWATVPNQRTHVLVRVCQNRRLLGEAQSLFSYLSAQPCEGTYNMPVEAAPRIGRMAREALMRVRFAQVKIQRPAQLSFTDYPLSVTLYAIEVKEVNPPMGQKPVHWRLLITHPVGSLEQALQVIKWYRWCGRIEQLFATLKRVGLNIEATQLESMAGIQRLTVLALSVAVRILQMVEGRENSDYRSQRPPGMPTLVHGLRKFESIFLGWKLAQT